MVKLNGNAHQVIVLVVVGGELKQCVHLQRAEGARGQPSQTVDHCDQCIVYWGA